MHRCPIYLACILLGAIGEDHLNVQMTFKDTLRYYGDDPEKMKLLSMVTGRSKTAKRQQKKPAENPARRVKPKRVRGK